MSEQKKEKAILLAKEINDYSYHILDAVKDNHPPTVIMGTMIIALRKLDHLSENKLSKLDSIIFGNSEKETDLFVKESIRLFGEYKKHVEQIEGSVKILDKEPIGIFIDQDVINEHYKNQKNGSKSN